MKGLIFIIVFSFFVKEGICDDCVMEEGEPRICYCSNKPANVDSCTSTELSGLSINDICCKVVNIIDTTCQFPYSSDCSYYYECDNGMAKVRECPPGTYFNSTTRVCDHMANVDTSQCTVPENPCDLCGKEGIEQICKMVNNEYCSCPNQEDCAKFYVCSNGVAYPKTCDPAGTFFNPILSVCDYPYNVDTSECNEYPGERVHQNRFRSKQDIGYVADEEFKPTRKRQKSP